jgi:adenosine deaminase
MGQWDAFIRGMPKAENHLHFCGIIEPELMLELSRKNRVPLRHNTLEELQDAYQFTNLQSFIDLCIEGTTVVVDESDFYAVTMSYLRHAQAENIIHTEMFFEPQLHMMQGIPIDTMMKGILRALDDGEQHYGISSRLILSVLRNASEEEAFRTLEAVMPYRSKLHGVGLASSELGYPPSRFERFFRHCRELGLHLMAHAGEEGAGWHAANRMSAVQCTLARLSNDGRPQHQGADGCRRMRDD